MSDELVRSTKDAHMGSIFKTYISRLPAGSLLDIGCSDGILMEIAAAHGWRVMGIDSYAAASERIIKGRFLDWAFRDKFDFIAMVHSFEHMEDPRATIAKISSLLTADGRLLIVVPNFGGWWSRIMGQEWPWLNPKDHRYHYTGDALRRLVDQAGLQVERIVTYSAFAPSLFEAYASSRQVFDWPVFRLRFIRSAFYKIARHSGFPANILADALGKGAELQVLVRPK